MSWAVSAVLLAHFSRLASLFTFPTLSCQLHLPRSRSRPQGCVQSHLPMISPKDVPMKPEALIPPSFHFTALKPFSIRMTVWPPKRRCLITSCRLSFHRGGKLHVVNSVLSQTSQTSSCWTCRLAEEQVSRCRVPSQSEVHISNLFLDSPAISERKPSHLVGIHVFFRRAFISVTHSLSFLSFPLYVQVCMLAWLTVWKTLNFSGKRRNVSTGQRWRKTSRPWGFCLVLIVGKKGRKKKVYKLNTRP